LLSRVVRDVCCCRATIEYKCATRGDVGGVESMEGFGARGGGGSGGGGEAVDDVNELILLFRFS
jgi:hypothetical protein